MGGSPAAGCGIVGAANRARGKEADLLKMQTSFKMEDPCLSLLKAKENKSQASKKWGFSQNPGPDQSSAGNHFLPNPVKVLIHLSYVDTEVSYESYTHRYRTQIIFKENYGL